MRWGYTCSSEEFPASDLVANAVRAEQAGFDFVTVSDHFHPWTRSQGHSPLAWTTIGAIAAQTDRVAIGTGVTCPLIRIHPTIVAQAAATCAELSGGRFFLGVGSGEALNEHIVGEHWPVIGIRHAMLIEAVDVIRQLWTGNTVTHHGEYYTVENARVFEVTDTPPDIVWAASGPRSATLAAEHADGLWSTSPSAELVAAYRDNGGDGEVIGQLTICWHPDAEQATREVLEIWPNAGLSGQLNTELQTWREFEAASEPLTPQLIGERVICGDDVQRVVDAVKEFADAGFTSLHFHQVGQHQRRFLDAWESELGDGIREVDAATSGAR